ncbi:hypothetical protein SERLADRAFT_453964 [Serpula lacrymans var. lacrymans S7.9]|uniref:Cytochrome P450 n=1 Tax=Serpula lacrymans var. lacrymans (strain S7.9) TaxID=578457 RepID=F8PCW1_SERL9|nr:uncharacterized protein SERLADRAFT_453964 [Serpula lacrymans var. lacrymans S7.9]EGO19060.1 hypothetical protein SERLADRAFT_453964 [Serpula lacrymans var. lacrymans S7.9]
MPSMSSFALALLFVVLTAGQVGNLLWKKARKTRQLLPPGPRPLPFLGNLLDIEAHAPWISYAEWGAMYGDLVYSRVLGQEIFVINSEKVAKDLLEKRAYNYSDRPYFDHVIDRFGLSFSSVFLPYGDLWRMHRRLFQQSFRNYASLHYRPMQLRKARQLLLQLLSTPESYADHFQTYAAAIVMSAVCGYEVTSCTDPLVMMAKQTVDLTVGATAPRKVAILNAFPFLFRLPLWLPGANVKHDAFRCRRSTQNMLETAYRIVQEKMHLRTVGPCMVSDSLRRFKNRDATGKFEAAIKDTSATAFCAGSETTSATLLVFLLAMVLHPRVQERAQLEIDSIVGTNRLPDFSDRPSLPYIDAIVRETLRWHPVAPLGVPHATTSADVYEGYCIPKGATVIANAWAMSRNEHKYPNPSEFKPERFLTAEGKLNHDTVSFAYGFGRRICVGRYMADASLWSAIVSLLAEFRFTKAQDTCGKDIKIEPQWTSGSTSHPLPFPCHIVARSPDMTSEKLAQLSPSTDS